jgi:hypothetical protein
LMGGVNLIKRDKPIVVFEFSVNYAEKFDTNAGDIYHFLTAECGLEVSVMSKWLQDKNPFSKLEFLERVGSAEDFYFIAYEN